VARLEWCIQRLSTAAGLPAARRFLHVVQQVPRAVLDPSAPTASSSSRPADRRAAASQSRPGPGSDDDHEHGYAATA
jgi:hypothetical protein